MEKINNNREEKGEFVRYKSEEPGKINGRRVDSPEGWTLYKLRHRLTIPFSRKQQICREINRVGHGLSL